DPAWSPDGRRIAFTSRANPALDDPEKKKPKHEPRRLVTQPVWRWNDQGFVDPDHLPHLWVIDAAGGEPRQLTGGRCSEAAPRGAGGSPLGLGPDGRTLVAMMAKHGSAVLVAADLASGEVAELTPAGRDLIAGTSSADGRRWALTLGDWEHPGDLHLFDLATRKLTRLAGVSDTLLESVKHAGLEEFWYRSFDGTRIQAW